MKNSNVRISLLVVLIIITLGIANSDPRDERLIEIANNYKSYNQDVDPKIVVTDSSKYKWTIYLCAHQGEEIMGYHYEYDSTFFSNADTITSPHGNKQYKLFVKDQSSYDFISKAQPIGQTLVKETWNVQPVSKDSLARYKNAMLSKNDSNWYVPTTISQLFIMYKEEPANHNDQGWVYGIVDVENELKPKVLSKGNISSCIACHKGTKYDRLFGRK